MYLKKILIFNFILSLLLLFIGCESTARKQTETLAYNQPLKIDNTIKKNQNISKSLVTTYEKSKDEEIIAIGLMLPLSGEHYRIGRSLLNSAQYALQKTGQNKIIFYVIDTGNEDTILSELYRVLEKNIKLIIGPVFTDKTQKIKNITKEKNIPVISLSNNSELEEKSIYVFGLTLEDEIKMLLSHSNKNGISKYAAIIPQNKYGERVKSKIEYYLSKKNSASIKFIFYDAQNPDFYEISKKISNYEKRKLDLQNKIDILEKENSETAKRQLKKLKKMDTYGELDFEALLILTQNFEELTNLSSILPYYDVDPKKVQFMGNSIWGKNLSLKEPGLDNGYFTSLDLKNKRKFEEEYLELFKSKAHPLAPLIYDLIGLISKLHTKEDIFNTKKLHSEIGFIGINGWFKFNDTGKVIRNPNLYKIRNQKFLLID